MVLDNCVSDLQLATTLPVKKHKTLYTHFTHPEMPTIPIRMNPRAICGQTLLVVHHD